MKRHFLILLLLLTIPTKTSQPAEAKPSISLAEIEALRLELTLPELLASLEQQTLSAQDIYRQRRWKIIRDFYRFHAAKKELELLSIEAGNLQRIHKLNEALSREGKVSDVELLKSHNSCLSAEGERIAKLDEARDLLLEVAQLCNLDLKGESNDEAKERIQTSH